MKKISIISFSPCGYALAETVREALASLGYDAVAERKYKGADDSVPVSVSQWSGQQFKSSDALVFVGAAGVAVRAIAPFVKDKTADPAVIAMDEKGNYCIPVLSGHLGGANELAKKISGMTGASAVITTATDLHGKWAADMFARRNDLKISDMKKAKELSSKALAGEKISVYIEERFCRTKAALPEGLCLWENGEEPPDVAVSIWQNDAWSQTLYLIPKALAVGIGCRKGTGEAEIESQVRQAFGKRKLIFESIFTVSSIDLKKEEAGLLEFCKKYGLTLETYSAEELRNTEGEFASSDFVKQIAGVDNVCERSAVRAAGEGALIRPKQAGEVVTVAAAVRKWSVDFE